MTPMPIRRIFEEFYKLDIFLCENGKLKISGLAKLDKDRADRIIAWVNANRDHVIKRLSIEKQ